MPPQKTKSAKAVKESKSTAENEAVSVAEAKKPKAKPVKEARAKETKQAKPVKESKQAKPVKESKQAKAKEVVEVEEEDDEVDGEVDGEDDGDESSDRKKRTVPTMESIDTQFGEIIELISVEVDKRREASSNKPNGVKFLRTINKRLKTLRSRAVRVMKKKKTRPRSSNTNSGFLKPVLISQELADFTGWDPAQTRSRVEVTKHLCDYIKEHNLQNPNDRRQIVPDKKLAALLSYDGAKNDKPLFYYSMQTHLKPHFKKVDNEA